MAHNLSKTDGKTAMAYIGAEPWHRQGTSLGDKEVSSAKMLKAAGLGYEITLEPVFTRNSSGQMIQIDGKNAVVRADTGDVFNVLSDRWEPIQNADAFTFFDGVVGEGQAVYHTAGALGRGERIWILARLPHDSIIAGDKVEQHILLSNGHDGGNAFTFQMTPIRVVCQNTLNIAIDTIEHSKVYRQFHLTGATSRLDPAVAAEIIGLAGTFYSEFEMRANAMAKMRMSKNAVADLVAALFPVPAIAAPKSTLALPAPKPADYIPAVTLNLRDKVTDFIVNGRGNDQRGSKGTAWGAFNGIVEFADYARGQDESRAKQLLFGQGRILKQKAWNLLNVN